MFDLYTIVLPAFVVGTSVLSILWIVLFYHSFISSESSDSYGCGYKQISTIFNFYKYTAFLCFTLCFLTSLGDTIHGYLSSFYGYPMLANHFNSLKCSADLLFFCAAVVLNIILFGRLYFTFKFSHFALSRWTILLISFQIVLAVLLCITFCALIFFIDDSRWDVIAKPVILGIIGEDLAVSLCTVTLFIYKLHQLIHHRDGQSLHQQVIQHPVERDKQIPKGMESDFSVNTATERREMTDATTTTLSVSNTRMSSLGSLLLDGSELGAHQLELIEVITRHTVLGGFAIFFNVMPLVICYFSMDESWEKSIMFGLVTYGCRLIGMIGMIVSLYLSMKFSNNLYFNCCLLCHWNCFKCCIRCTRKASGHQRHSSVKQRS